MAVAMDRVVLRVVVLALLAVSLVPAFLGWALIRSYAGIPAAPARLIGELRLSESEPLGFVQGIAVSDSGEVFAADQGGRKLVALSDSVSPGTVLASYPQLQLSAPQAVALGPDGAVYLLDKGTGVVSVIDRQGNVERFLKICAPGCTALAIDNAGRIYSADAASGALRRFLPSGDPDLTWGATQPGATVVGPIVGLILIDGLAYATTGRTIVRLDGIGRVVLRRPLLGNGGMLGRGPFGTLLMSDMTMDSPGPRWQTFRVWVLDREGRPIGRVVGPDGRDNLFDQPRGIAVGPLDRIYVANGSRVSVYQPEKRWTTS